jgi:hypothetical protein
MFQSFQMFRPFNQRGNRQQPKAPVSLRLNVLNGAERLNGLNDLNRLRFLNNFLPLPRL